MNKVILLTSTALFLFGCAATEDPKEKDAQQTPQFGKPESSIPWNAPSDWEKNGQLGSMPGLNQSH